MSHLRSLLDELARREELGAMLGFRVPALWRPLGEPLPNGSASPREVNPYVFLREHVEAILAAPATPVVKHGGGDWLADAAVYNMFVRLASAYDHDGDGRIGGGSGDVTLNEEGVRETGTFLKAIALLGHIRALGCDTVHLLPVTAVGRFGNKGRLGSPYAIKNPYRLEPSLADPLVDLPVEAQMAAFVEACHHLGIRVILEFVFRTSARDSDWIAEHPEWYYWIRREIADRPAGAAPKPPGFGMPPFDEASLDIARGKVGGADLTDLPAPPDWYRAFFSSVPKRVTQEEDGRWLGASGVHVPSAFADWPPDDPQPPWTDVTFLRMYDHADFNYVAYNTIRYYDARLARPENAVTPLWDAIRGIIPHYQRELGIDAVMVDMGHALPAPLMRSIIEDARKNDADFALMAENFVVSSESRETGYNAVVGYQFYDLVDVAKMRALIERTCVEGLPIPVFGSGETHNSPRVAMRDRGARFSRTTWLLNAFLPHHIPYIHNGFELGDAQPVNLGLAFTDDELHRYRDRPLGLFDARALDWDHAGTLPAEIVQINALRPRRSGGFTWIDAGNPQVIAFRLGDVSLFLNWDAHHEQVVGPLGEVLEDLCSGAAIDLTRPLSLAPGAGVAAGKPRNRVE